VAAAACVVVALLPPILYFNSRVEIARAKIAAVDDQLMPLRSVQTRNEENLRQIEEAKKQIAALHAAYDTKSNWINFFSDLQSRLVKVEDVWLERLQVVRASRADEVAAPVPDPNAAGDANAAPKLPPLRLTLSGKLLDVANPQSRVSSESLTRAKALLASFTSSQFIAAVENERFDNSQNGLLRFDFTVVINPQKPL
jgi:type IV pilus assembly protein PilM